MQSGAYWLTPSSTSPTRDSSCFQRHASLCSTSLQSTTISSTLTRHSWALSTIQGPWAVADTTSACGPLSHSLIGAKAHNGLRSIARSPLRSYLISNTILFSGIIVGLHVTWMSTIPPTLVTKLLPELNYNRSVTWADWSRGGSHPVRFRRWDITEGFFNRMRFGSNCTYNGNVSSICFLFARKFEVDALEPLLKMAPALLGF